MHAEKTAGQQCGITRFEFAAAVAIVAVLAGVLLERLLYIEEYAEMTAMELTIANMRTGLRNRMGDLLIRDKVSEIATLADENPVTWLEKQPENYLGEFDGVPDRDTRGMWFYDRQRREMVYTANSRRYFSPGSYADYSVRARVVRLPVPGNGTAERKADPQWVALIKTTDGKWF